MGCPFCNMPPVADGEILKVEFVQSDLCEAHDEMSGIAEFLRRHPLVDGDYPCTPTCGCIVIDVVPSP